MMLFNLGPKQLKLLLELGFLGKHPFFTLSRGLSGFIFMVAAFAWDPPCSGRVPNTLSQATSLT